MEGNLTDGREGMSGKTEAPKKIWLDYTPHENHLYLTDELVWTGYLTEYVRADYHEKLVEALSECRDWMDGCGAQAGLDLMLNKVDTLLATMEAEKRGGV